MAYLLLAGTIALNIFASAVLKASQGLTKRWVGIAGIGMFLLDYFLLSKTILFINVSIAYALLCGVGIICSSIISAIFFHQRLSKFGIFCAILIAFGVIFIHLFGTM